jgi:tetratricopeptide (TPR) repeat protein
MFAEFLAKDGKPTESLVQVTQAIQILTAAHVQDPKITLTQRALCRSHEQRAVTLDQLNRHAEAQDDWDHVLKLCSDDKRHIHRSQRADSLLRSGNVELAISEIDELSKIDSDRPEHWIRFAKLYAIASESLPARKEEFADRAIAMLKKAIRLGFVDVPRLKEDPELATLSSHPDFVPLVK